ncbi:MAG: hypothetical protein KGI70_00275 [Patescibacteria group bacterium]|nr:hypothetical protein [Patescibacteria group bacterium]
MADTINDPKEKPTRKVPSEVIDDAAIQAEKSLGRITWALVIVAGIAVLGTPFVSAYYPTSGVHTRPGSYSTPRYVSTPKTEPGMIDRWLHYYERPPRRY